jgi:prevent-host-death family protein
MAGAMAINTSGELTITATTFHRNMGDMILQTVRGKTVVVTRQGKPLFVLLDFAHYERLQAAERAFLDSLLVGVE